MDGDFQQQFVNDTTTTSNIQSQSTMDLNIQTIQNNNEETTNDNVECNIEQNIIPSSSVQEQNSTLCPRTLLDHPDVIKEEQIENFTTTTEIKNDEEEEHQEELSDSEGRNKLDVLLPAENKSVSNSFTLISRPEELIELESTTANTNENHNSHDNDDDRTEVEQEEENNENDYSNKNDNNNDSQQSFNCDKCDKKFKKKHHLSRHIITHAKRKPFTCTIPDCLKGFTRKENLAKHIKLHENEENNDQTETDNNEDSIVMQVEMEEDESQEKEVEELPKRKPGRPRKYFNVTEMKDPPWTGKKVLGLKNSFRQKCLREGDKINITCHSCRTKFYSMKKFQTHLKNKNRHGTTTTTYNKLLQNRKYIKFNADSSTSSSKLIKDKENKNKNQNVVAHNRTIDTSIDLNMNQDPLQNHDSNNDKSFPVHSESGENSLGSKYCEKCGKTFRTERNRLNHYRLFHSEPKDNASGDDDDNEDSELDMLDGMKSDYDDEDFLLQPHQHQNPRVDYTVPSDAFLQSLNEQGTESLPFMCMICHKMFARKFHLKRHLVKKFFHCKFKGCEETFEYKCASRIHNNTFHEKDKSFCTSNISLTNNNNDDDTFGINENNQQSTSSSTATTKEGQVITSSSSNSRRPYKQRVPRNKIDGDSKSKSKGFLCSTCGFSCHSPTVFRNHIDRQDCDISGPGRMWKCNHEGCGNEAFESKSALRKHTKIHAKPKERPHKCSMPDCEKTFFKLSALKYHLERHSGIKPYKCTEGECSLTYATASNLRHHIRAVHLQIKRFLCEDCGKTFGTQTKLRIHNRSHTGERPYKCKVEGCNFPGFTTPGALSRHLKCHAKEKGYKCEQCGKGFNLRENLKRHILTHTGAKPYKCKLCPMAFPDNRPLKRHMATHQQEDESFSD